MESVVRAFASESMGETKLQNFAHTLDAKTSAEPARELEALDAEKESWADVLQNEKDWTWRAYLGLQNRIAALFTAAELKASRAKAE